MTQHVRTESDAPMTGDTPLLSSPPPVEQQLDLETWHMLGAHRPAPPLRITYATTDDPNNIRAWSGTVHHIGRSLEMAGLEMDYLGHLARNRLFVNKAINKLSRISTFGEIFPSERTYRMADLFAQRIRAHVKQGYSDVVFSPGSIPIALLKTKRPKVFYTDATFASILDIYPEWARYPKRYIDEGHDLERRALDNCDLAIYSSNWAARSAIDHYGIDPARVRVVPFGGNLHQVPEQASVERTIAERNTDVCELLFIGVAWERKGGPKVMELARTLHEQGVRVRLHLVGSAPVGGDLPPYVVRHGFISKETDAGRARLSELLSKAHFLLLPSMAECFGIVLCEANAFGVPALANDVGGIPEIVKNGINGQLFAVDAPASEWACTVVRWLTDRAAYGRLALSSRREYDHRLNWGVAGRTIRQHLEALM